MSTINISAMHYDLYTTYRKALVKRYESERLKIARTKEFLDNRPIVARN